MRLSPGDLVAVRCGPGGHWLATVYRGPGGALWVRYDPRQMLSTETSSPRVIASPRPGGRIEGRIARAPLLSKPGDESVMWVRCPWCSRQWPMSADGDELLAAAETARHGKPQVVIARPSVIARETGEDGGPLPPVWERRLWEE